MYVRKSMMLLLAAFTICLPAVQTSNGADLLTQEERDQVVERLNSGTTTKVLIQIGTIRKMADEDQEYFVPFLLPLIEGVSEEDEGAVSEAARLALISITYQEFGTDKAKWAKWWATNQEKTRQDWKAGEKERTKTLDVNADDWSKDLKLELFDSPKDIEYLSTLLQKHQSKHVRTTAAAQLAKIGDPSIFPLLADALKNDRVFLGDGIDALIQLGDQRAIEILQGYINSTEKYGMVDAASTEDKRITIGERATQGIEVLKQKSATSAPK